MFENITAQQGKPQKVGDEETSSCGRQTRQNFRVEAATDTTQLTILNLEDDSQ